jgi:hypothetical protein
VVTAPVTQASSKEAAKAADLWDLSAGLVNLDLGADLERKKQQGNKI